MARTATRAKAAKRPAARKAATKKMSAKAAPAKKTAARRPVAKAVAPKRQLRRVGKSAASAKRTTSAKRATLAKRTTSPKRPIAVKRATAARKPAPRKSIPQPTRATAGQPQRFAVSHLNEAEFKSDGLRTYAKYRDLGIADATSGLCQAHVIRLVPPCTDEVRKRHLHETDLQMIYVLKG